MEIRRLFTAGPDRCSRWLYCWGRTPGASADVGRFTNKLPRWDEVFTADALRNTDLFRRKDRWVQGLVAYGLHRASRRAAFAGLLYCAGLAHAQQGHAATVGEYQVKAAFLYHFAKFVEWPAEAMKGEAVLVGVLGKDPFGPALDFLFQDKTLHGRRFEVRRVSHVSEAKACHVLFVNVDDEVELRRTLDSLSGLPVLTVGNHHLFLASGGMIQLFVEESKVRFDINLTAAKQSGLAISAQLLRLARNVEGK